MTRQKSSITPSEALRLAYDCAFSVLDAAKREGYQPGGSHSFAEGSIEARRIDQAFFEISALLHRKAASSPRTRRAKSWWQKLAKPRRRAPTTGDTR